MAQSSVPCAASLAWEVAGVYEKMYVYMCIRVFTGLWCVMSSWLFNWFMNGGLGIYIIKCMITLSMGFTKSGGAVVKKKHKTVLLSVVEYLSIQRATFQSCDNWFNKASLALLFNCQ